MLEWLRDFLQWFSNSELFSLIVDFGTLLAVMSWWLVMYNHKREQRDELVGEIKGIRSDFAELMKRLDAERPSPISGDADRIDDGQTTGATTEERPSLRIDEGGESRSQPGPTDLKA